MDQSNEDSWVVIAVASIRRDIDEIKADIEKIKGAQEDFAKKEYAARIVARIAHRLVRLSWYGTIAVGGYALTHWARIKAFMEGWR